MYLIINKLVIAVKVSNFSGQYLCNHRTLDIGVLGYIVIVWPKEHSPEVRSFPPGTPCIKEWWSGIIIIIYTFLKLHLPECTQPKQTSLHLPPTPKHPPFTANSLNHHTFSAASPFFKTAHSHIIQLPLWFLPHTSNLLVTSHQQTAINASCRK